MTCITCITDFLIHSEDSIAGIALPVIRSLANHRLYTTVVPECKFKVIFDTFKANNVFVKQLFSLLDKRRVYVSNSKYVLEGLPFLLQVY